MRKLLGLALATTAMITMMPREAQAWKYFKFGVGLNLECASGNNAWGKRINGPYENQGGGGFGGPGMMPPGMGGPMMMGGMGGAPLVYGGEPPVAAAPLVPVPATPAAQPAAPADNTPAAFFTGVQPAGYSAAPSYYYPAPSYWYGY